MIFNKRYLFFFILFLLIINNSQALEDQKPIIGEYFQTYTIHNDNSADINFQIFHIYENNEDIYDFIGLDYIFEVTTFSKEPTYNHSISMGNENNKLKLVNHPPNSAGEFQIKETIRENSMMKGIFIHRVNFYAFFEESMIPSGKSTTAINLRFGVNNFSYANKSENTIYLSGVNYPDNSSLIKYETYRIIVDLPISPYFWSNYVSSTPIYPSSIISKGTGQSLIWDDFFGDDVIMLKYSITENPYPKRIDNLIEESNSILKQAQKSSDLALNLGYLSVFLGVLSVILGLLSVRNYISSYIEKFKK